jgi:hypothetical protein
LALRKHVGVVDRAIEGTAKVALRVLSISRLDVEKCQTTKKAQEERRVVLEKHGFGGKYF